MRVVIQRVKSASVSVNHQIIGSIDEGLLILLGIENEDTIDDQNWLVKKICNLRIFPDEKGMNLSIKDIGGSILVISQFTLYASTKKGNRPSFIKAAKPDFARAMYSEFIVALEKECARDVQTGEFGAMMDVNLINWGPVTIIIDTKNKE